MRRWINSHFIYEISELYFSYYFFESVEEKRLRMSIAQYNVLKNIAIEHVLLHVRNLYEFYFKPLDSNPNARVSNFTLNFNPIYRHKYLNEKVYKKICDQIAHLGWKRYIKSRNKNWHLKEMIKVILKITKQFIENVRRYNQYYFGEGLKSTYARLVQPLEPYIDLLIFN